MGSDDDQPCAAAGCQLDDQHRFVLVALVTLVAAVSFVLTAYVLLALQVFQR